jgi:hypothetical protein
MRQGPDLRMNGHGLNGLQPDGKTRALIELGTHGQFEVQQLRVAFNNGQTQPKTFFSA